MDDTTICVYAVADLRVARLSDSGRPLIGSHVARAADGSPLPGGERVEQHPHYMRALRCDELTLKAPAPVVAAAPIAEAPPVAVPASAPAPDVELS